MSADCLDIEHAAITNCRFTCVFASFLVIPNCTCAAARHDTGHAVIRSDQPEIGFILQQQAIIFFIRYAFRHCKTIPGAAQGIRFRIAAPVVFSLWSVVLSVYVAVGCLPVQPALTACRHPVSRPRNLYMGLNQWTAHIPIALTSGPGCVCRQIIVPSLALNHLRRFHPNRFSEKNRREGSKHVNRLPMQFPD